MENRVQQSSDRLGRKDQIAVRARSSAWPAALARYFFFLFFSFFFFLAVEIGFGIQLHKFNELITRITDVLSSQKS